MVNISVNYTVRLGVFVYGKMFHRKYPHSDQLGHSLHPRPAPSTVFEVDARVFLASHSCEFALDRSHFWDSFKRPIFIFRICLEVHVTVQSRALLSTIRFTFLLSICASSHVQMTKDLLSCDASVTY